MTTELPTEVLSAVSRIEAVPAPDEAAVVDGPDLTGALGELRQWWQATTAGAVLTPATVSCTATASSCSSAVVDGIREADRVIDSGATLVILRSTVIDEIRARALIGLLTRREASAVLGQPEGMTDAEWMNTCARIRDTMAGSRHLLGEPLALLEAMHALVVAEMAGVLLGAAARRTPVLLDGTEAWAAALVADRISHRARLWWRSATTSSDPARESAIERLTLPAGVPLDLSDESGWGSAATVALLELVLDRHEDRSDR